MAKKTALIMANLPARAHSKVTARKASYGHKPSIRYFESSRHLESVQRLERQERLERLAEEEDRQQLRDIAHALGFNEDGTELE
jgi:hypothetical protein